MKKMPGSLQAADYSVTVNYLAAVKAAGTDDSDKVLAKLKASKVNDMFAKNGWIRADGSMIHDMYLMQVKSPDKSTEPWDYYNIVETFKGEAAWTTKSETKCATWK
jgi:branched-chain amino acid transport system substrate-binding protein